MPYPYTQTPPRVAMKSEVVLSSGHTPGSLLVSSSGGIVGDMAPGTAGNAPIDNGTAFASAVPAGGSTPVEVTGTGLTVGSDYELAEVMGSLVLRNLSTFTFPVTRTIALADTENGGVWVNRGEVDAADRNSTLAGAEHWDVNQSASGPTAARWAQTFPFTGAERWVACRVRMPDSGTSYRYGGLFVYDGTTFHTIQAAYLSGAWDVVQQAAGATVVALTEAQVRTQGLWLMVVVDAAGNASWWYSTSNTADFSAVSWVLLYRATGEFLSNATLTIGKHALALAPATTGKAEWLDYRHCEQVDPNAQGMAWPQVQGDIFATAPTGQLLVDDFNVGSLPASKTNTELLWRKVLSDVENRLAGNAATITWAAKASSTTGASEGTYRASSAFEFDAWTGSKVRLWCKITSATGAESGSILLPFSLPIVK